MEFLSLEASDYESALRQARSEHGNAVRIHTRKDFTKGSLLAKQKRCAITYYLVKERALTPEPEPVEVKVFNAEAYLANLLTSNDIPLSFHEQVFAGKIEHSQTEIEVQLLQSLFEGIQFEDEIGSKFAIFVGAAGVGKTTTLVKTALYLRAQKGKKVALLSFDTQRTGSVEQIRQFAREFALPLYEASDESALAGLLASLKGFDHILVDTSGRSAKDEELKAFLDGMLAVLPFQGCSTYLVVSASHKESDLLAQQQLFAKQRVKAIICTKLDETNGIGNLLSFVQKSDVPLLFLADGQTIPQDFHPASAAYLMTRLQGFSLDLLQFFPSL